VQARRRTALLSVAIGLVTMLLVLMQSLAAGIEDSMVDAATTVSAGHVNVAGFWKATPTQAAPFITDKARIGAIVEANTPGLDYVVPRHRGWGKVVSDQDSVYAGLSGIEAKVEDHFFDTVRLAKESEYVDGGRDEIVGDPRDLANPHTIMMFAGQAKRLRVRVGDSVTLVAENPSGQWNTIDATVVAVARDMGFLTSWSMFVPTADVCELYAIGDNTTGAFWIYLKDVDDAPDVMKHLREVLAGEGYEIMDHHAAPFFMKFDQVAGEDWIGTRLDLTTWDDEVSFLTWVLTAFHTITWLLVLILVAIVAVGITNTMWNSVRDRTGEIGTMRAIGMREGRVMWMILFEAVMLGGVATAAGAVLGSLVALGVDAAQVPITIEAVRAILLSDTLRLSVRPLAAVESVVMLTFFVGLAAIWPARRAAALRPITAIQHVE